MESTTPPINIHGLITQISEYSIQFKILMFGYCQAMDYLDQGHKAEHAHHYYRIVERDGSLKREVRYNGLETIKDIEGFAIHFGTDYPGYLKKIGALLSRTIRDKYLINVYEVVKNFSDHNKEKKLFEQLQNQDWFRIMHILRRNASHFDNYGKAIGFPDGYPDTIGWNGLEISRRQIGHTIVYSDAFLIDLIGECHEYLRANTIRLG